MIPESLKAPWAVRGISWACALLALTLAFAALGFVFHRAPFLGLVLLATFKYVSAFYMAGRMVECLWLGVSRLAVEALSSAQDTEASHG